MERWLLDLLACPVNPQHRLLLRATGDEESDREGALWCDGCGLTFPIRDGIPILLPPGLDGSHVGDEFDYAREHKRQQADYFDREVAAEFEISRPQATPLAYQWLIAQKFRLSVELLPPLRGSIVVDTCCGSGMDAQFLARDGARVIAVDISEGCAARARARKKRHGLDYSVVVGDVEHLPIRTGAADISYVHDGLHHLSDPLIGVRELARVARYAVSINEPAEALGTQLAVRLGISMNRESAGNRVARLRPKEVVRELQSAGFEPRARRYVMYYKHEPGRMMRFLSRPGVHGAYRWMVGLSNSAIGRWGNKLQVTAIRAA
jgi:ubiquinone/menaquinone biosynthesis C-methylase UbiE/uncharacterized protein YbaR (Trm112 family)